MSERWMKVAENVMRSRFANYYKILRLFFNFFLRIIFFNICLLMWIEIFELV